LDNKVTDPDIADDKILPLSPSPRPPVRDSQAAEEFRLGCRTCREASGQHLLL